MAENYKKLADYRFSCSLEALEDARLLFDSERYRSSLCRAYYAIYHAIRGVNALDQFNSSTHAEVISHFLEHYVRTGAFPTAASKLVNLASEDRERVDSLDFYVASRASAESQLLRAQIFLDWTQEYLRQREII